MVVVVLRIDLCVGEDHFLVVVCSARQLCIRTTAFLLTRQREKKKGSQWNKTSEEDFKTEKEKQKKENRRGRTEKKKKSKAKEKYDLDEREEHVEKKQEEEEEESEVRTPSTSTKCLFPTSSLLFSASDA